MQASVFKINKLINYSWTSRKQSLKLSSLGGCLLEEATYESLDHIVSKWYKLID